MSKNLIKSVTIWKDGQLWDMYETKDIKIWELCAIAEKEKNRQKEIKDSQSFLKNLR
jgi:hypothetical protein